MNIRRSSITAVVMLGLAGVGLTGGVSPTQAAYAAAYPATATAPGMTQAKKGDPVAVIYYRCHLDKDKCTPLDGLYYVHNAVALEDLPIAAGPAYVSHVPKWPSSKTEPVPDNLYICDAERAALWAQGKAKGPPTCHGDTAKQPWVVEAIHAYPQVGQPPIAWKVTKGMTIEGPHNGAFRCFIGIGSLDCNSDIKKILPQAGQSATLEGTLRYSHFANANPATGEDARTAKKWEKFTMQTEELRAATVGGVTEKITIVQRLV